MIGVTYVNSEGEELNLTEWPYMIQGENLFDYDWKYNSTNADALGGYINGFYKSISEISFDILIHAATDAEFSQALNNFFAITEKDVIKNQPGRLVLEDGYYMPCFIFASSKKMWRSGTRATLSNISVISEHPFWCKDVFVSFDRKTLDDYSGEGGVDFLYDFSYDLQQSCTSRLKVDSFLSSDFEMIIYGPVAPSNIDHGPSITIGDQPYCLVQTLENNEYVIINSRLKTITLYRADGTQENIFNNQAKDIDVFKKIPKGIHNIEANVTFDITVFSERSEPVWNLS